MYRIESLAPQQIITMFISSTDIEAREKELIKELLTILHITVQFCILDVSPRICIGYSSISMNPFTKEK